MAKHQMNKDNIHAQTLAGFILRLMLSAWLIGSVILIIGTAQLFIYDTKELTESWDRMMLWSGAIWLAPVIGGWFSWVFLGMEIES